MTSCLVSHRAAHLTAVKRLTSRPFPAINFDPCLEVGPGVFYDTKLGDRVMGLNIALGDIDEKERGQGNFANFHHEDWFAGTPKVRTRLKDWGTLRIRTATCNQKNAPR